MLEAQIDDVWLKRFTLVHILLYFKTLLELKRVSLSSFSDSKSQHAKLRLKSAWWAELHLDPFPSPLL